MKYISMSSENLTFGKKGQEVWKWTTETGQCTKLSKSAYTRTVADCL